MSKEKATSLVIAQNTTQIINDKFRTKSRAFCLLCEKPVQLIDFKTAANHLNTSIQELFSLANKNELHRIHNSKATVMICSNSLFRHFENRQTRRLTPQMIAQAQM